MRRANYEFEDPYFDGTDVYKRSATVPSNQAMISSYRLLAVTVPLTEVVWPQCKYLEVQSGNGGGMEYLRPRTLVQPASW